MATLNPYLAFDGDCRKAMEFYKECLGGELRFMKVSESPMGSQVPPEARDKIMHASLESGAITIMASDNLQSGALKHGDDLSLMLYCTTEKEIHELFPKLSAGGKIGSALKEEFWGAIYGDFVDKFGVRWMMNFDKPKA
ncbi:MAG: VOC family protein [Spirochaetaceae bacterium]|nr:VOC family protein [Spirochaetaceae bacterium]